MRPNLQDSFNLLAGWDFAAAAVITGGLWADTSGFIVGHKTNIGGKTNYGGKTYDLGSESHDYSLRSHDFLKESLDFTGRSQDYLAAAGVITGSLRADASGFIVGHKTNNGRK